MVASNPKKEKIVGKGKRWFDVGQSWGGGASKQTDHKRGGGERQGSQGVGGKQSGKRRFPIEFSNGKGFFATL